MTAAKTHISLNVADVARSARFYSALFDAPVNKEKPGYVNFDLEEPALKLALNEKAAASRGEAVNHFGVQVATVEAVVAARERLKAAGLATFDESDVTCCYALQEKVWVTDPDGNAWEVYVLLADAEVERLATNCCEGESPNAESCCADADRACCAK
ncbi:MAG: ArsI/CadI family heavy metal resistance metalloenzyme [Fimbriimonadaceae bacterium]